MEMKLLEQLYHWRNILLRQAREPAFIPLTREEFQIISTDCGPCTRTERFMVDVSPTVFGIDTFETPFAEDMRHRQIDIPVIQIAEGHNISNFAEVVSKDASRDYLHRRLIAHICHDTTEIKLTFEWDILAKFKRKFRLTKWWPVKTRTVILEGRVLYPYLKVSLPRNKHHAQFKHTQ